MAGTIGQMSEFLINGKEVFLNWEERLQMFFLANDIADPGKQKAVLLTVCGPELYQLVRSLTYPGKPTDHTYADLIVLVTTHLNPKPNIIVERYKFNMRVRKSGESVSAFVGELWSLSRNCEYNESVNDMIRDRLVVGINDIGIQKKLLGEGTLTLKKAMSIAVGMETASREAATMSGAPEIHGIEHDKTFHREKCFRCGDHRHKAPSCWFKDKECFQCKKKGHAAKVCANKKKGRPVNSVDCPDQNQATGSRKSPTRTHETLEEDDDDVYHVYKTEIRKESPVLVQVEINGRKVKMELDTGASISVASKRELEERIGKVVLKDTKIKLKTYGGRIIEPLGVMDVEVRHKDQVKSLPIVVTTEPGPLLFGRNWLREITLDWRGILSEIFQVVDDSSTGTCEPNHLTLLLNKYEDVFRDELGTMKDVEVHIELKEGVKPRFFRARPVPYALKHGIEESLERLLEQGIYEPVAHSLLAAPIVPVRKDDGEIRICGDYKLTINQSAECDTYPVPKTEDLLATLNGGVKFSKLDLRQAYQQLKLDEDSQKLCTINTHRGLFQPTRLQYGIHSAAGIFQREMERRLTGVPNTIVRVDDILVTGKNDREHLDNLEKVLDIMMKNGLRLKRTKCTFFSSEVTYLGFKISSKGVETVADKVQPILEAPAPTDTTQLKSFLGMLQYYHRHLPNLASKLEPLHQLLRKGTKWEWGQQQEVVFKEAKKCLASSELLVHYDPCKQIRLAVDASPYGVGAVLSHAMDGEERPVAYASRTLNNAERNYSQTEREGLAVVYGVKKFHQYLLGLRFQIYTDHKPLLGILGESKPIPVHSAARIQRWALLLAGYNYELFYKQGKEHGNADGMSRLPVKCEDMDVARAQNHTHMVDLVHAPVTASEVKRETERDPVLCRVKEFLIQGWPENLQADSEYKPFQTRAEELTVEDGCILWGGRVVIPPKLREKTLQDLHLALVGASRMNLFARGYCWWPLMDSQIRDLVAQCDACVENAQNPPSAVMHPWEIAKRPWSRIHIDHAGPFLGHLFLIVVDSYSKWVDIYPVASPSTENTIEKLRMSFAVQGLPEIVVSDNASGFTSGEFAEFMKKNGIRHTTSAPYHPSTNGAAERTVQSFKRTLKKMQGRTKESINTQLSRLLFTFRHTPSTATGRSPSEVLFRQKPRTRLNMRKPDISVTWQRAAEKMKATRTGGKDREFEVGNRVIARSYREGEKWLAGIISKKTGPVSYEVRISGGVIRRHVDQIRKDHRPEEQSISTDFGSTDHEDHPSLVQDTECEAIERPGEQEEALEPVREEPPTSNDDTAPTWNPPEQVHIPQPNPPVARSYPRRIRNPPKHLEDYSR
jgi:hypothetical protein